ncbi:MAG: hypothetical protein O6857_00790 [Nitrospinae bacterium]|nr:hypothetical protein [Nitrospinota bacterium]
MKTFAHKIGAVMYFVWGLLHLKAAYSVYQLGTSLEAGMIQGRIFQGAWNLLFFALVGITVAVVFNWHNSRLGYWINLTTVSVTDIGFIAFVLAPGYLPIFPGILGPVFWLLGAVFSTIGLFALAKNTQTKPAIGS